MSIISDLVEVKREGDVAVIQMRNPPVNALSFSLRVAIANAFAEAASDDAIRAVVLAGTERAFSAGADISEFDAAPQAPFLPDLIAMIERFPKPVIAAIRGIALGGGLELALGCHARVVWPCARLGLPEIKIGLLPGAGGTQRLPRLIGIANSVEMILSGNMVSAEKALADGLVDQMISGPFPGAAIAFVREPREWKPVTNRPDRLAEARQEPGILNRLAAPWIRRARDPFAARACIAAIRAAFEVPFEAGLAEERRLLLERRDSAESKAQRYGFFAEREARKIPGLGKDVAPRKINRAVVLGAGTMGGGIAMSLADAGIPVTIVEAEAAALERGLRNIAANYATSVKRGSIAEAESARRQALITGALDFTPVGEADLVIEAVFEEMEVKRQVFGQLDRLAKPWAVLATNTSYLDVNEIAASTSRPEDVVGMHFFSPANVMRLLEVVRGKKTSLTTLVTAVNVGLIIGKAPVVVGVCYGFVGNRILAQRFKQADRLLLEGALPEQIDRVLTTFGFRMGAFATSDLSGLDVSWRVRKANGMKAPIADALCEAGRFGLKVGRGYYVYEGRVPKPDPEVAQLIAEISGRLGYVRREISDQEILERLIYPMINEGARILEEGIAARPGDIDVIWQYGYNWPAWRGGPMWYADQIGLATVRDQLEHHAKATGDVSMVPSSLLRRLAETDKGFSKLSLTDTASL